MLKTGRIIVCIGLRIMEIRMMPVYDVSMQAGAATADFSSLFYIAPDGGSHMIKTTSCRIPRFILVTVAGCFLLSSCGLTSLLGESAESGIKKSVTSFLKDVKEGTFTDDGYESKYADDTSFADLPFKSKSVTAVMDKGFTKIIYSVDSAQGDQKTAEGTCDVSITAVDVKKVLSGLEGKTLDEKSFMAAVKNSKAPMADYTITLDMTYSSTDKLWRITDLLPLLEILGEPYAALSFGPAAAVDSFMTALAKGDADTINSISPNYNSTVFFNEDKNVMKMITQFYSRITYEFKGEPDVSGETASVTVKMKIPDILTVVSSIANDPKLMADVIKPVLLASIKGEDQAASGELSQKVFSDILFDRFKAKDVPMTDVDAVFTLKADADKKGWVLTEIPKDLYDIKSEPAYSDAIYMKAAAIALKALYDEKSIDKATYDEYAAKFEALATTSNTAITTDTSEPTQQVTSAPTETTSGSGSSKVPTKADIKTKGWYDYNLDKLVSSYSSKNTYKLEYDIEFSGSWPDLTVYYEFYNVGGTVLMKSASEKVHPDGHTLYLSYEESDKGLIYADKYKVVIYLKDKTKLVEASVTVK